MDEPEGSPPTGGHALLQDYLIQPLVPLVSAYATDLHLSLHLCPPSCMSLTPSLYAPSLQSLGLSPCLQVFSLSFSAQSLSSHCLWAHSLDLILRPCLSQHIPTSFPPNHFCLSPPSPGVVPCQPHPAQDMRRELLNLAFRDQTPPSINLQPWVRPPLALTSLDKRQTPSG